MTNSSSKIICVRKYGQALCARELPPVRRPIWLLARGLFEQVNSAILQCQAIGWTKDSTAASIQDMSIDHRRANIAMAKQFLNSPNVVSVFQ